MLKDITLGQYFPGNSVLHRIDPRMKIILMILFVVSVFFAKNYLSFAMLIIGVAVLCALSGVGAGVILKSLKPLIFIMVFTGILNLFWTKGDHLLIHAGFIKIYREGIETAIFMIIRIVSLVAGTSVLLSYTTSPMALTDAIERLLSPLKKIHVPVHEFAMMMTLALRFIPTLIEETDKIISAQKARGADFESGNILRRAKAFIPILIPLFFSAFRRADDLSIAMECRLYHGGEGRTRMNVLHLRPLDAAALAVCIVFISALIVLSTIDIPI